MGYLHLILLAYASFLLVENLALPSAFVVSPGELLRTRRSNKEGNEQINFETPRIYEMYVKSNVSNRFAQTTVVSKVRNMGSNAQEATFSVVLPESAFISGFIMEVDGKNYTAYVKEKEEAKRTYDQAVSSGLSAAHVAASARDSNRFTVFVNIEPESKAAFYLTYEELFKRKNGHYELIINLHPGQPVKELGVEVVITESRKLTKVRAPPLRSGNEIGNEKDDLDPRANIEIVNDTTAIITFSPNLERQKQIAHLMGGKEEDGLSAQFVVQYDVERDPQGGEVLVKDGYFVHFFSPLGLSPLPKHVVFVLDTSSSMWGQKIIQLREAMLKILDDLNEIDLFHLVEFNTNVKVWDLNNNENSVLYPYESVGYGRTRTYPKLEDLAFPHASMVNANNIQKAKDTVSMFTPRASTDIYSALKVGLHLVEMTKMQSGGTIDYQPIIVFLTDGEPTVGVTSAETITNDITEYNSDLRKSPIFSLSFGSGADKKFLQKLSLRNNGFSKYIYDAADASLQLQDFYSQISSPLLANVTFKYEDSVTDLTTTKWPIYFDNSEIIVTGYSGYRDLSSSHLPDVYGWDGRKQRIFKPILKETPSSIERLWAYLTVKQLLDEKEISDNDPEELKKKALDLSLKYSFVTAVSSLVVVKPNEIKAVDAEEANADLQYPQVIAARTTLHKKVHSIADASIGTHRSYSPMKHEKLGRARSSAVSRSTFYTRNSDNSPQLHILAVPERKIVRDIFALIPWLKNFVSGGVISLSKGNYKLGLNETITDAKVCPKTPMNTPGHCSLLHLCPSVHSYLTSVDVLVEHFCVLENEFAGVCCP